MVNNEEALLAAVVLNPAEAKALLILALQNLPRTTAKTSYQHHYQPMAPSGKGHLGARVDHRRRRKSIRTVIRSLEASRDRRSKRECK